MGKGNNPRPLLITLIAILNIILGLGAILVGGLMFTGMTVLGGLQVGAMTGGVSVIIGLIYILIGIGFLSGWSIMWYLGVIFEVLGIILNVLTLFVGNLSAIISILISLIILLYLFKPNVKKYFLE